MARPTYRSRWPEYARQWDTMIIKGDRVAQAQSVARKLVAAKDRYVAVEKLTGVPWYMIAVIHMRESSQDWKASLAQGDPWNKVSTHVPKGRGPFRSWEEAAVDALNIDGLAKVIDWRLEKIAYYLESYNGWGYFSHGVPSPYVWSWTNIQKPGKYTADGYWSPNATDTQPGCMALLKAMMALDQTIKPVRES